MLKLIIKSIFFCHFDKKNMINDINMILVIIFCRADVASSRLEEIPFSIFFNDLIHNDHWQSPHIRYS